jgi:hypothetical protein
MTQEEKDLLLQDLCARLPYGVMAKFGDSNPSKITNITQDIESDSWFVESEGEFDEMTGEFDGMMCEINNIKPYLFPMSSMSKEQNLEFLSTCIGGNAYHPTYKSFDWLDKNLFDYRGLIPMGLANDATELSVYTNSDE